MSQATRKRSSSEGSREVKGREKKSKYSNDGATAPTLATATEPELYVTIPPQPREKKPGQLTPTQLQQFFEEGYVMIPDFFRPSELNPVREGIAEAVEDLVNKLYNSGKINDKCSGAGLFERMILIEKQFPGASVLLHKTGYLPQCTDPDGIQRKNRYSNPYSFRDLWSNERLLNAVEQMIGPDIAGHPVWNLRVKTPQNEQATVPWHQDNAYLDPEALHVLQPTAWMPMLDVDKQNGCMQVIPRGHRKGVTAPHTCCVGGTWYVQIKDIKGMKTSLGVDVKDAVTMEMPYGGVLFMNNAIPHRSVENFSDKVRWSLDLRWQQPDKPNGFYGIKESVLMRSTKDPNHVIDFDSFDKVDRHHNAIEAVLESQNDPSVKAAADSDKEFDTTIIGPWMKRWELVHHNKHTAKFVKEGEQMTVSSHSWDKA